MSLSSLSHLLNIFRGDEPTPAERKDIFNETVLLVLARATDSDANIKPIEVETVCDIVKKTTGEEVSGRDVRMAAHSKIYESEPLDAYLQRVGRHMDLNDRVLVARALAEVIQSDERTTAKEVRFFDMVATALEVTPAALVGLVATH